MPSIWVPVNNAFERHAISRGGLPWNAVLTNRQVARKRGFEQVAK
jgi:hypothetical protein